MVTLVMTCGSSLSDTFHSVQDLKSMITITLIILEIMDPSLLFGTSSVELITPSRFIKNLAKD